ncbi:hypothetical protein DFH08DRAFT_957722 [Mycena albidolilacea]|uniref:Glycoside hydrolase family 76 protein n=1 Tax=Mycena albidolilacea TaxID=1033008 RepID=A0AAD7EU88_9AGAR|nr:hypothetical protein DFH08DRAFT_957722 [Mycena albidolilacea]
MALFLSLVGLLLRVGQVASQLDSPSWNSTMTTSPTEIVRLAGAALDVAVNRLDADGLFDDAGYGIAGNLYSQMAEFDIATNQTKSFGHAAVKAYTAYNNREFLQYAVDSWWFGRSQTLSQSDVSVGKIPGKNFSIPNVCQNATMVGGVFLSDKPAESRIAGTATGYFLVLSALLAEATSDPLYLQAANESADFIHSHLFNARNIVQDYIFTDSDRACEVQTSVDPTSSGLMIEGLSILASITNSTSTRNLLTDLLMAVIPNPAWQGDNGVVSVQGEMGGLMLLRGLATVYTRWSTNTTLRKYVGDYIAVQFNPVTALATASGTNIYGTSWKGPPNTSFSGTSQTLALGSLISAIGLDAAPSSSPAPSLSPAPAPQRNHRSSAILGGTLGGLAILVLILTVVWLMRLRHHRNSKASLTAKGVPKPFLGFVSFSFSFWPISWREAQDFITAFR